MYSEENDHDIIISKKERNLYVRCISAAPVVMKDVIESLSKGNAGDVDGQRGYHGKSITQTKNDYTRLPAQIKVDLLEYALAKQQKRDYIAGK